MERLNLLGVALGLAALAGINLYLTVFVTGLAIHYQWITLAPAYQSLSVLGHPWVIGIAGTFYLLEFFADKIPWVDSIWDAVHTVIRPIGGALLAIQVLGHPTPVMTIVAALLGGGTSLASHTAKTATRLASNTSPEPFSNIALSVGEDIAVVGGLTLIYHNPVIALGVFAVALGAFFYFAPKLLRLIKAKLYLAWKKLNFPATTQFSPRLPLTLPGRLASTFSSHPLVGTTAWVMPCISGRGRGVPANLFGALVAVNEEPQKLIFIARKSGRPFTATINLEECAIGREPRFLSENVVIAPNTGKGPRYLFQFPRSAISEVEKIVEFLQQRLSRGPTPIEAPLSKGPIIPALTPSQPE